MVVPRSRERFSAALSGGMWLNNGSRRLSRFGLADDGFYTEGFDDERYRRLREHPPTGNASVLG